MGDSAILVIYLFSFNSPIKTRILFCCLAVKAELILGNFLFFFGMKSEIGFFSCLSQIDKEALDDQVKEKKIEEAVQKARDDSIGIYIISFFKNNNLSDGYKNEFSSSSSTIKL